ncbi:MAG: PH domain-containing protein [Acidimicrobiales bacterium]
MQLDPAVLRLWRIKGIVTVTAMAGALVAAELILRSRLDSPVPPGVVAATTLGLGTGVVLQVTKTAWQRWRLDLGDDALELRHGFVFHRSSLVPWYRVQQLNVESGPLSRALGLSELVVPTASAHTNAHIPGLRPAKAEELRAIILRKAGARDGV